jgi:hypothetical protein
LALFSAMEGNGQIAQGGHDAGAIGISDGATILIPVPVAYPMKSVFDGPMAAGQAVEGGVIGLLGLQTGQQEDAFLMDRAGSAVGPTVQPHGLSGEGKVDFGPAEFTP